MFKKLVPLSLALLMVLALAACSGKDDTPGEDNPGAGSSPASLPPQLSVPAPQGITPPLAEAPEEEDSAPGEDPVEEMPPDLGDQPSEPEAGDESDESEGEASGSSIGPTPLAANFPVSVGTIDATGAAQGETRELLVSLPAGWSVGSSILYFEGGKIGEIEPCRIADNPDDPYGALNLPGEYQTVDVNGERWITWAAESSAWDQGSGSAAAITTRHYYKAEGNMVLGMYLYLFYDGSPTVNEGTALDIFASLGTANPNT
ncbi:MAG: hypothetical protein LBU86_05405 [Oscillospiraceae bacterium]|jgi:hypothetical protein|nr:hypothetical protein [Oscillospiraceae bacterium]